VRSTAGRECWEPDRPTLSVYQLIDGEYQVQQFRDQDRIISAAFPDMTLTAAQVFAAGQ
jgi:Uma2 family endonuclease